MSDNRKERFEKLTEKLQVFITNPEHRGWWK
jgi:hypothetical protein